MNAHLFAPAQAANTYDQLPGITNPLTLRSTPSVSTIIVRPVMLYSPGSTCANVAMANRLSGYRDSGWMRTSCRMH